MKRIVFLMLFMAGFSAYAQNLQLHYDMGKDRHFLTSTVELFKPDTFGSTFFFIDMDYNGNDNGVSLAYFEIARDIKFWQPDFTLHVEYNGGNMVLGNSGIIFDNNWLFGGAYTFYIGKSSITTQLLYKSFNYSSESPDFQWTNVWFVPMLNYKIIFTGFIDIWSQDKFIGSNDKQLILLTEPQLWYAIQNGFSIGTEVEISKNFVSDKFEFMPTLGVKYDF